MPASVVQWLGCVGPVSSSRFTSFSGAGVRISLRMGALVGLLGVVALGGGCASSAEQGVAAATGALASEMSETEIDEAARQMLAPWQGKYGGVPPLEWLNEPRYLAALTPAMLEAMALHNAEIEAIANNPEPPTFTNTVGALEASGGGSRSRGCVLADLVRQSFNARVSGGAD